MPTAETHPARPAAEPAVAEAKKPAKPRKPRVAKPAKTAKATAAKPKAVGRPRKTAAKATPARTTKAPVARKRTRKASLVTLSVQVGDTNLSLSVDEAENLYHTLERLFKREQRKGRPPKA